jgi:hypothetical protein
MRPSPDRAVFATLWAHAKKRKESVPVDVQAIRFTEAVCHRGH